MHAESKKLTGILGIFLFVFLATGLAQPDEFFQPFNLQNLIRRTGLYGILALGVVFPIVTGGIDLSIGSVVGLVGTLVPFLLVQQGWGIPAALAAALLVALLVGLFHGLLITRLGLQPFVVTLCGLLLYRGLARWMTGDMTQGFGEDYGGLRALATSRPLPMSWFLLGVGLTLLAGALWRRRSGGLRAPSWATLALGVLTLGGGVTLLAQGSQGLGALRVPAPFLLLVALAAASSLLLRRTVFGRHLYAVGRNPEAARYAGIDVDRVVVWSYVLCGLAAGIGGVLFALDVNSVQPASLGNFYELYAIAAAVLGGCSLRGGEGSVLGVVLGAAVLRVLYNSINLLGIPHTLVMAIIGGVLLLGVCADELLRRALRSSGS